MQRRYREILFFAVMLALFVCAYLMVFRPASLQRAALRADIWSKRKTMTDLRHSTAGMEELQQKIAELQKTVDDFESHLSRDADVPAVTKILTDLATANSLKAEALVSQTLVAHTDYREQPIALTLTGDFNGLYTFLLELEKLPQLTRVTQMKLQKLDGHDGQARADLTLSLFLEPSPRAVATLEKE